MIHKIAIPKGCTAKVSVEKLEGVDFLVVLIEPKYKKKEGLIEVIKKITKPSL